jgi:hypothetical protein
MELQQLIENWTKEMTELKNEIQEYEYKTGKSAVSAEARLQAISEILADVKQLNLTFVAKSVGNEQKSAHFRSKYL